MTMLMLSIGYKHTKVWRQRFKQLVHVMGSCHGTWGIPRLEWSSSNMSPVVVISLVRYFAIVLRHEDNDS